MATVFLPSELKGLTEGRLEFPVGAGTVGEAILELDRQFPGLQDRLCDGTRLRSGLAVAVDGHLSTRGLKTPLKTTSEVHFLPAIGGG